MEWPGVEPSKHGQQTKAPVQAAYKTHLECLFGLIRNSINTYRTLLTTQLEASTSSSLETSTSTSTSIMSVQSISDASAFFDLPEDYAPAPFEHRLLQALPRVIDRLEKLLKYHGPANPLPNPLPAPALSALKDLLKSIKVLEPWRKEVFHALNALHRDVYERSVLRKITTGSSSKLTILRAVYAMRCHTTLVKQIRKAKHLLRDIKPSVVVGGMAHAWLIGWVHLITVEANMKGLIMKGIKPVDEDVAVKPEDNPVPIHHPRPRR